MSYLNSLSSDEATSNISGKINSRIWGRREPQEFKQHEKDSPKLNA